MSSQISSKHDIRIAINPTYGTANESGSKYVFLKDSSSGKLSLDFKSAVVNYEYSYPVTEDPTTQRDNFDELEGTTPQTVTLPDGSTETTMDVANKNQTFKVWTSVEGWKDVEVPIYEKVKVDSDGGGLFNPLKSHHGTKANQAINFYINDMHTKSLGTGNLIGGDGNFIKEEDEDRYWALSYDKTKQAAWLNTLKTAQNKTLDDISVITQQSANVAVRVLDGAIDYALDESTRLGAYLQRLEYTDANVTTMGENVQSAESTIRDADMAKEMSEYTKANVLVQAAQSMLAQANQNSSAVLSLLK